MRNAPGWARKYGCEDSNTHRHWGRRRADLRSGRRGRGRCPEGSARSATLTAGPATRPARPASEQSDRHSAGAEHQSAEQQSAEQQSPEVVQVVPATAPTDGMSRAVDLDAFQRWVPYRLRTAGSAEPATSAERSDGHRRAIAGWVYQDA